MFIMVGLSIYVNENRPCVYLEQKIKKAVDKMRNWKMKILKLMVAGITLASIGFGLMGQVMAAESLGLSFDTVFAQGTAENNDHYRLSNIQITGFTTSEVKALYITFPSWLTLKNPDGWYTASDDGDGWTSYSDFSGNIISYLLDSNNSATIIQNYLESVKFEVTGPIDLNDNTITIALNTERMVARYGDDNRPHYYKFIYIDDPDTQLTWLEAYNTAKSLSYNGLTGYLTTITSQEEQDFVYNSISQRAGWLGGTRLEKSSGNRILDDLSISEVVSEYDQDKDDWYWANGPETGEVFTHGKSSYDYGFDKSMGYNNWARGGRGETEPNNADGGEFCLQFAVPLQGGGWNDLPIEVPDELISFPSGSYLEGYYVEFSEYGTQIETMDLDSDTVASSRAVVANMTAPTDPEPNPRTNDINLLLMITTTLFALAGIGYVVYSSRKYHCRRYCGHHGQ